MSYCVKLLVFMMDMVARVSDEGHAFITNTNMTRGGSFIFMSKLDERS